MAPIPARAPSRRASLAPVLLRAHVFGASFSCLALALALVALGLVCLVPSRRRSPSLAAGVEVGMPHVVGPRSGVTYGTMDKISHISYRTASPTFAQPRQSMPILILAVQNNSPRATDDWTLSSNPGSSRGLVLKDRNSRCTPVMHRTNGTLRYGEKYRTIGRSFRLELAPIPEEPQSAGRNRVHSAR